MFASPLSITASRFMEGDQQAIVPVQWTSIFVRSNGTADECTTYAGYRTAFDAARRLCRAQECGRGGKCSSIDLTHCEGCKLVANQHNMDYTERSLGPMQQSSGVDRVQVTAELAKELGTFFGNALKEVRSNSAEQWQTGTATLVGIIGYGLVRDNFCAEGQAQSTFLLKADDVAALKSAPLNAVLLELGKQLPKDVHLGHCLVLGQGPTFTSTDFAYHTDTPQENHHRDRHSGRAALTTVTVLASKCITTNPSGMHVLGKDVNFEYGGPGDTAVFLADCVHSSLVNGSDIVKLVCTWVFDEELECQKVGCAQVETLMRACMRTSGQGALDMAIKAFETASLGNTLSQKAVSCHKYLLMISCFALGACVHLIARPRAEQVTLDEAKKCIGMFLKAAKENEKLHIPGTSTLMRGMRRHVSQMLLLLNNSSGPFPTSAPSTNKYFADLSATLDLATNAALGSVKTKDPTVEDLVTKVMSGWPVLESLTTEAAPNIIVSADGSAQLRVGWSQAMSHLCKHEHLIARASPARASRQTKMPIGEHADLILAVLQSVQKVYVVHCSDHTERKEKFMAQWKSECNPLDRTIHPVFVTEHMIPVSDFTLNLDDVSAANNHAKALLDNYRGHCSALHAACKANEFPAVIVEDNILLRPLATGEALMENDCLVSQSMGHIRLSAAGMSSNPKMLYFASLDDCHRLLCKFLDSAQDGRAVIADKMYLCRGLPAEHQPLFAAMQDSVSTIAVDTRVPREEVVDFLDTSRLRHETPSPGNSKKRPSPTSKPKKKKKPKKTLRQGKSTPAQGQQPSTGHEEQDGADGDGNDSENTDDGIQCTQNGTQTATLLPCCCCLVQPIKSVLRCGHGVCDTCASHPATRICPLCKQAVRGSPIKLYIFHEPKQP